MNDVHGLNDLERAVHLIFEEKVPFNHLLATGYILRLGNKVAVTRMELHNDDNNLIAVGTGAYTVSLGSQS